MKDIKVLGIDLAKNIFQLHGVDSQGKTIFRKRVKRERLAEFMANIPPCLVGLEACGGSHYWARRFKSFGHEVKLMSPQFVKPYVKTNKNDFNDAQAIAEAVTRPTMRFVPVKNIEQQETLTIHRVRSLLIKERTALTNHIRGLLMEFGVIIGQGIRNIRHQLPGVLEDAENELTPSLRHIFQDLYLRLTLLDNNINEYDNKILKIAKSQESCQRIMKIEGIGALTATAIVATIGNATDFKNGREMAAWLGLVPKQKSSGNKIKLLGISKRGDRYIRALLVHGGRSVVRTCETKEDSRHQWVKQKKSRSGNNKTAVAVANKNVRIIWALLAKNEAYRKAA